MNQCRYKTTLDRTQRLLLPERVEETRWERIIRSGLLTFIFDTLDLASLGFKHTETGTMAGQPPYNP